MSLFIKTFLTERQPKLNWRTRETFSVEEDFFRAFFGPPIWAKHREGLRMNQERSWSRLKSKSNLSTTERTDERCRLSRAMGRWNLVENFVRKNQWRTKMRRIVDIKWNQIINDRRMLWLKIGSNILLKTDIVGKRLSLSQCDLNSPTRECLVWKTIDNG